MKLYLLTRMDNIDWDECTGAVIAAESAVDAEKIIIDLEEDCKWKCTLLSETIQPGIKSGIILDRWSSG